MMTANFHPLSATFFTGGNTVSELVGRRVTLQCSNKSISRLTQLTWKMNEDNLLTYQPNYTPYAHPAALRLNINMSDSQRLLYPLIIERAQTSHTGNYTCETTTIEGPQRENWELIITGVLLSSKS